MRVYILTEGGRNIGFGHITSCIALAQGIKVHIGGWVNEKMGRRENEVAVEFIVKGDDSIKNI